MSRKPSKPDTRKHFSIQFPSFEMRSVDNRNKFWRKLTARELQVARLAAQRLSDIQIATELCITEKTVGNHLSKIFIKLDINSRHELKYILQDIDDNF